MDPLKKARHQRAVDRALAALETAAGSERVMSHLTSPGGAPASNVLLEDLVEALRRFREVAPA